MCAMLSIVMHTQAQIDLGFRRADNDEIVQLESLIKDKKGNYQRSFLITWSAEWCEECKEVIKSMGTAAKSGLVQVLTVNVDVDWKKAKVKNIHNTEWTNTTNLYVDKALVNSFGNYFSLQNAPIIIFFNEYGVIQYMAASLDLRSHHFADFFGKEFIWQDWQALNSYVWSYYLTVQDGPTLNAGQDEKLKKAFDFIDRSIKLEKNYYNTDTYAALLYISGQYTEALKTAKEAIDIAKANSQDYKGTTELIEKIIEKM